MPLPTPRVRRTARRPRRLGPSPEALESRALMAVTPTAYEQYMLELINRTRANPAAEGQRLKNLARTDPLIAQATVGWDLATFVRTISAYGPLPPLAFNTRLIEAARDHDAAMLARNSQYHSAPYYLNNPRVAVADDGRAYYDTSQVSWATGENVFAFSENVNSPSIKTYVDYFHAGFVIDWGNPNFGHLTNILAPGPASEGDHVPFSEIGIGLLTGVRPTVPPDPDPDNPANAGFNVGPALVTQEFGWRSSSTFLTGTFYNDADRDRFYTPGEGLGGVTVRAVGQSGQGTFQVQTWSSGGYSLDLPPGVYSVVASGGGLAGSRTTSVAIGEENVGWSVAITPQSAADLPVVADYSGDGRADLATYRTTTAEWTLRDSTTGLVSVIPFGWAGVDVPVPARYDGGPRAQVAVYRPTSGEWMIRDAGGAVRAVSFGWAGHDVPVPGDFDGDGRSDLAVYRPESAQWFVRRSTDGGVSITPFGWAGVDQPVSADFDGDGKTDLALFRPTTAQWFVRRSTDGGVSITPFGWAGQDLPRPGDFDGDGRDDLAVYRPSSASWFVRQSTGGDQSVAFGMAGVDQPIPADFDGDGKADVAVYRPSTSEWFVRRSTDAGTVVTPFAQGGTASTGLATFGRFVSLPKSWYDVRIPAAAGRSASGTPTGRRVVKLRPAELPTVFKDGLPGS